MPSNVELLLDSEENVYPYGGGEHFAYAVQKEFSAEVAAFVLWMCNKGFEDRSISHFLDGLMLKFGDEEAIFCARYLEHFDRLPELMPETRERILLMVLDFDEDIDPDLQRFRDE